MFFSQKHCRRLGGSAVLLTLLVALGAGTGLAAASGPPVIGEAWTSAVFSSSARVQARINPNGSSTAYRVDYITKAAYEANLVAAKEGFTSALRSPPTTETNIGAGNAAVVTQQQLFSLSADTVYRYRVVAHNSLGTVETSPPLTFATQGAGSGILLQDSRDWEQVSPVDKNGGEVAAPGAIAGGGVLQAAANGQSVTYGSEASFAGGAGAPPASQYIATRTPGGWTTQNITAPLYSGSYNTQTEGVPYQLFSADLARGLLLNGRHCRSEGSGCAVPNPPLSGTDAPEGYQDYYLRESSSGAFTALLGAANAGFLTLEPADFELRLAGSSPDLQHAMLSTCAALTANATEVPAGNCDLAETNLYEYSPGAGLGLVNILPAQTFGTPGATLAAQSGAVSGDGSRVYFTQGGDLYLRKGGTATAEVASGATFQTASADGSTAFYTMADEHLYRYEAGGAGSSTDITPSGGVLGVLGASDAGSSVYYLTAAGLFRWHGTTTKVADAADASNYPPPTGTARVSADGTRLLFVSTTSLGTSDGSKYDNKDLNTGNLDSEVYLYDATGAGSLTCVSCNPTFERPIGPSSVPGAIANGSAPGSARSYKPRSLSANGRRVFFNSRDALVLTDTNNNTDAYQWEVQGEGSCNRAGGCVGLLSSGRSPRGATFIDASVDGSDAFFLTDDSLVASDPGAVDLYDARIGGGFPTPPSPIPCEGDACQSLPPVPVDPTLTTLLGGPGNPGVRYPKTGKHCKKGYHRRHGKCVRKRSTR